MCGINIIFDQDIKVANKRALISVMNQQMLYRGPDDEGLFSDQYVALGMRRLSIIDVAGGAQPLFNEDRSLVLVCNGEIYNYVELRRALEARGHHFQSGSDTETILHLYEEKGEACLDDLRGMFAFALWDSKRQRLFAARDRVGIKPLYMSQQAGVLWLSSELKAIVATSGLEPTLRPAAVYQFLLYWGYAIDERNTVVEQVKRVLPGEYLLADASGVSLKRYWRPIFPRLTNDTVDRTDDELREMLATAVALHLRSDVPVSILLSGGVDSSGIAAFAARAGTNYSVLCAGYSGSFAVDERAQAHATAASLGLSHEDVMLDSASFADEFDRLTHCVDEPTGDIAAMPMWALFARARERGYKVLLSGLGGDEVFFGYPAWNIIAAEYGALPVDARANWDGLSRSGGFQRTLTTLNFLSDSRLYELIDEVRLPLRELREQFPPTADAVSGLLFSTYLVNNGCFLADKLAMGNSIEVRVPLLDHVLVEAVFRLPLSRRLAAGQSKILLKRLLRGSVPDTVLDARKRGFSPPGTYVQDLVLTHEQQIVDGVLASDWLNRSRVCNLFKREGALPWLSSRHMRGLDRVRARLGLAGSSDLLFRILAFEQWYSMLSSLPKSPLTV